MKFFHISDLHIGLNLLNRDLYDDQKFMLDKIINLAEKHQPNAIIMAGDIYDRSNPSAKANSLFDSFINGLKKVANGAYIFIISGNHDSAERLNLYRNILSRERLFLVGKPPMKEDEFIEKVTLKDEYGNVNFYLLPFVKPAMVKNIFEDEKLTYNDAVRKLILRENIDKNERNIIASHQFYLPVGKNAEEVERADEEIVTVGNIDEVKADVLYDFDYAALGHLHRGGTVGKDYVRYAGTPMQCSVSEVGQEKGILCVDIKEKGNINIEKIVINPLRKIRKLEGTLENILENPSEDYVNITISEDELNTDAMDRIRAAFPYLLKVIRKEQNLEDKKNFEIVNDKNEMDLIKDFLGEIDENEEKILNEILNNL
ncbi:MAG: exonuclease SbcCD subunit D [Selenomonadaceae bacterium]|nr:exonuclease SbcCD subunit D [Selenomonadaceae bacterium]